jgi:hypothetical protein
MHSKEVELRITPVSGRPMTEEKHRMIGCATLPVCLSSENNKFCPAAARKRDLKNVSLICAHRVVSIRIF